MEITVVGSGFRAGGTVQIRLGTVNAGAAPDVYATTQAGEHGKAEACLAHVRLLVIRLFEVSQTLLLYRADQVGDVLERGLRHLFVVLASLRKERPLAEAARQPAHEQYRSDDWSHYATPLGAAGLEFPAAEI